MININRILNNIISQRKRFGGKNDLDGDGIHNKKDCQPRNTMRQDVVPVTDNVQSIQSKYFDNLDYKDDYQSNINKFIRKI